MRFFAAKDSIIADFQRYTPSDPLCCPSGHASVFYKVNRTPAARCWSPSSGSSAKS